MNEEGQEPGPENTQDGGREAADTQDGGREAADTLDGGREEADTQDGGTEAADSQDGGRERAKSMFVGYEEGQDEELVDEHRHHRPHKRPHQRRYTEFHPSPRLSIWSSHHEDLVSEVEHAHEEEDDNDHSPGHACHTVTDLGPEEVRWFYQESKKVWRPFIGYDSLRIELTFRRLCDLSEELEPGAATAAGTRLVEPVYVRGGLYEVDVVLGDCYPVYWDHDEKANIMRGQWFIDGTWLPLAEQESDLIELEHHHIFNGRQLKPPDCDPKCPKPDVVIHTLKLRRSHVDWHSVNEVFLYSDATTSKIARKVTQKLGFSKASSLGTRLHRGYVEEASLEDKPPQITHIVFVVHGIGQKMDQGRIIKNTTVIRDMARKVEEKRFPNRGNDHVEFLPVEWRSKLSLDGDIVHSITPQRVPRIRKMLNSSAMDVLYYTSPLYRDELVRGLEDELNRLYTMFCSQNPEFPENGGKVSILSHSLGCVIAYDIMTGWNPVRLCEQLLLKDSNGKEETWVSNEERYLIQELYSTKQRLKQLEERLHGLKSSPSFKPHALKFKVENFFCVGSPLAVFLALRGIRPGNQANQDHILPQTICSRLFNIFYPTDPVAYRLEPLILKNYASIAPVQIHLHSSTKPVPYHLLKPCFLKLSKEMHATVSDIENMPSASMIPAVPQSFYKQLPKYTDLEQNPKLVKGIEELFTRLANPHALILHPSDTTVLDSDTEEAASLAFLPPPDKDIYPQCATGFHTLSAELEHRMDFELRESFVESSYVSAITSHTAYWASMDLVLFLLTFFYKPELQELLADDLLELD